MLKSLFLILSPFALVSLLLDRGLRHLKNSLSPVDGVVHSFRTTAVCQVFLLIKYQYEYTAYSKTKVGLDIFIQNINYYYVETEYFKTENCSPHTIQHLQNKTIIIIMQITFVFSFPFSNPYLFLGNNLKIIQ